MVKDPNLAREIANSLRATYDGISDHFDRTRSRPWPETAGFMDSIEAGSRVLDMGCGNGRNALYLAERGHEVAGMDFSLALVGLARQRCSGPGLRVHFLAGDLTSLPFGSGTFDAALYVAALHHLPSREMRSRSLEEVWRCLRPGGEAIVSVWAREQERYEEALKDRDPCSFSGREEGDAYIPWKTPGGGTYWRFYHFYGAGEFARDMDESPLTPLDLFRAGDNHCARVLRGD